ncbi:hypothetical protein LTR93_011941 [Exophiala xenobiotica]|nr:hypothetical protein LTR93_011941 [Exophiala xenobiotica]
MTESPKWSTTRFDPNFTRHVIDAMGPKTSPRMREVIASLITHLHEFARDVELTVDEWMAGVKLLNWAGQMSNDKRNEGQPASEASDLATQSVILRPFFRHDHPVQEKGADISFDTPADATPVYMYGRILDATTKKPLTGATIDVWEASTNGFYEQQLENQVDFNLRGKFVSDQKGEYALYCLKPTAYPVLDDGPAGKLLQLLDRHPYRPAHIHLINSKYLDDDSGFAVKDSLIVKFLQRENDSEAKLELKI